MAVDWRSSGPGVKPETDPYGPIEPLTLKVLHEELDKLHGTLSGDTVMDYEKCLVICDGFIEDLGACLNASIKKYPEDKEIYDRVFDGLQEVIDLLHGTKEGLTGADGYPRLMDDQEARMTADDKVIEIMDELNQEMLKRGMPRSEASVAPVTPVPSQALTQAEAVEVIKRRPKSS